MPAVKQAEQTAAERQIQRAKDLEKERYELGKRINSNREYLRLMDANEELQGQTVLNGETVEMGEWLDVFYPQKERGQKRSKDEIEATRKAKQEARGVIDGDDDDDTDDDES